MKDTLDIKQRLGDFNIRFNSVFRNFNGVSIDTFLFLFDSFCHPNYGLGLWDLSTIFSMHNFKIFETSYNNALKRIIGVHKGSSSHVTADICNHLLLKHYVAFNQARYMKRVISQSNDIFILSLPWLKTGYLSTAISKLFKDKYEISFWDENLDIIKSRITWVQKHEERRAFHDFYGT